METNREATTMDEQNLGAPAAMQASPADKTQVIMDLVSALDAFETSTPVTGFPEKIADKAKAARALAAELKDDLLLLKQHLEEAGKDLGKLQGSEIPSNISADTTEGDLGRFAALAMRLDQVATECERIGLGKLAATIDSVSNTLDKRAFTFKNKITGEMPSPSTIKVFDALNDFASNILSGDNTAKAEECWKDMKHATGLKDDLLKHILKPKIDALGQFAESKLPEGNSSEVDKAVNNAAVEIAEIIDAQDLSGKN